MAKKNFYAVAIGKVPGIYRSWASASLQVTRFHGAVFKGFATESEAKKFLEENSPPSCLSSPRVFPVDVSSSTSTPHAEDRHGTEDAIAAPAPPAAVIAATKMCDHPTKDPIEGRRHSVSPDRSPILAGTKRHASAPLEPSIVIKVSRFSPDLAPPRSEPAVHVTAVPDSSPACDIATSPRTSRWGTRVSRWGTVTSSLTPVPVSPGAVAKPQSPQRQVDREDRLDVHRGGGVVDGTTIGN